MMKWILIINRFSWAEAGMTKVANDARSPRSCGARAVGTGSNVSITFPRGNPWRGYVSDHSHGAHRCGFMEIIW